MADVEAALVRASLGSRPSVFELIVGIDFSQTADFLELFLALFELGIMEHSVLLDAVHLVRQDYAGVRVGAYLFDVVHGFSRLSDRPMVSQRREGRKERRYDHLQVDVADCGRQLALVAEGDALGHEPSVIMVVEVIFDKVLIQFDRIPVILEYRLSPGVHSWTVDASIKR